CCDGSGQTEETQPAPFPESSAARAPVRRNVDDSESPPGCTRRPLNFPAATALRRKARGRYEDRPNRPASSDQSAAYRLRAGPTLQLADRLRTSACLQTVAREH